MSYYDDYDNGYDFDYDFDIDYDPPELYDDVPELYCDVPDYNYTFDMPVYDPPDFDMYESPYYYNEIDEDEMERRAEEQYHLDRILNETPADYKQKSKGTRALLMIPRVMLFIVCLCFPPLFLLYIAIYGSSVAGRSDIDWTNVAGP